MTTLAGCLPQLSDAEQKLRDKAARVGIVYHIADYGALRTKATVDLLIKWRDEAVARAGKKAYYRVSPYSKGYHPRGAAFDVHIDEFPHMKMSEEMAYATLGQLAHSCGLKWGGNFSPPRDIYHYQLDVDLEQATGMYAQFAGVIVPIDV